MSPNLEVTFSRYKFNYFEKKSINSISVKREGINLICTHFQPIYVGINLINFIYKLESLFKIRILEFRIKIMRQINIFLINY